MAFRTLTFDTEVAKPVNGYPATTAYISSTAHKINNVYVLKENNSPLKLNMTVDQLKTDVFGESLTFALLADKNETFGNVTTGSDVTTWKSWYDPRRTVGQATSADRPSYYRIPMGGAAGGPAIVVAPGEFVDLPSTYFHFGATDQWTIFVALETVTKNSSRDGHLFGGTNASRSDLVSIWGIENNKCAVIDAGGNDNLWSGSLMSNDCVRMLSHSTSKEVWDFMNGEEVLNDTSTFTHAFNFDFLNKSETTGGTAGSATFWIRELLVYNESIDVMGATQRQEIEGYLGHKWGTNSSLLNADGTTGHPYVTTDPRDAKGTHTVRKFESGTKTTALYGYNPASPPSMTDTRSSVFDIETFAGQGLLVPAGDVVQFVVEDMDAPGKVYIKIEYTEA